MRSLKTIQKLSSLGSILSKIAFVLSVVGFCGCIAGLIGLRFGSDAVLKLGDIRLHGLIADEYGRAAESVAAALCGWVFVCAGKAVLAKTSCGPKRPSPSPGRRSCRGSVFWRWPFRSAAPCSAALPRASPPGF